MTFFQWNAGGTRQRLDVGALSGCSMHFGMMQEVDEDIVASLERWGATVHVHEKAMPSPGKPTCTFARAQFIERSELLWAEVVPRSYEKSGERVESWLLSYSIASYQFKFPIAGRDQVNCSCRIQIAMRACETEFVTCIAVQKVSCKLGGGLSTA